MRHTERKRRCEETRPAGSLRVHPPEEGPAQPQVPSARPVWPAAWFKQERETQTCLFLYTRKRAKLQGHFKGMVKGAQKGALSGKKMQKRKRKAWKKKWLTSLSGLKMHVCWCIYTHIDFADFVTRMFFKVAARLGLPLWTLMEPRETPLAAISVGIT